MTKYYELITITFERGKWSDFDNDQLKEKSDCDPKATCHLQAKIKIQAEVLVNIHLINVNLFSDLSKYYLVGTIFQIKDKKNLPARIKLKYSQHEEVI